MSVGTPGATAIGVYACGGVPDSARVEAGSACGSRASLCLQAPRTLARPIGARTMNWRRELTMRTLWVEGGTTTVEYVSHASPKQDSTAAAD